MAASALNEALPFHVAAIAVERCDANQGGDWIKIRTDLYEDQKVLQLSDILGTDDLTTVGLLVRFWSWADKQTSDGTGIILSAEHIDRLVGREGFAKAMRKVGWLAGRKGNMFLPGFQKHNGSSAKARSLESEAKRLRRSSTEHYESVAPNRCFAFYSGCGGRDCTHPIINP